MRRLLLMAAVLAVALVGVAACGADDPAEIATAGGNESDESVGEAELSDHEQGVAFAQCMRDNDVDVPDPDPNGGGGVRFLGPDVDREAVDQALQECRHLAPEELPGGEMDPETVAQLREFAQCMRDNGIDLPDPDPNGGGFRDAMDDGDIDPSSPEFQAAIEQCEDLLSGLERGGMRR